MDTSIQSNPGNPCSLDNVLHNVNKNLVYDPVTKKLCLKTAVNKNVSTKNVNKSLEQFNTHNCDLNDLPSNTKSILNIANSCQTNKTIQRDNINNAANDITGDELLCGKFDSLNVNDIYSIKRPDNLPPKSKDEERKHRAQFLQILQQAKRKDLKAEKLRKNVSIKQIKQEIEIQKAIKIWTDEILPCWSISHITRRVQDLWWNGIPSSIRPKVWSLIIGNDLHITEQLFHICIQRSKESIWTKQFSMKSLSDYNNKTHRKTNSSQISSDVVEKLSSKYFSVDPILSDDDDIAFHIKLDVLRTFPQLGLFQEMGPYHESLCDILSAYMVYRPDIGYCQGMSFLAAMLLLNSQSTTSAFISLANLLNNDLLLAFYALNQNKMKIIYSYYDHQFYSLLPNLAKHFAHIGLTTDLFFMYQVYTIFARSLSLDCVSRVWDLFLRDGNEFLFRASLGILSMFENELINLEFIDSARFLSNLPDDMDTDKYFEIISTIKLKPPKLSTLLTNNNNNNHNNNTQLKISNNDGINTENRNLAKSRYSSFVNKFLPF